MKGIAITGLTLVLMGGKFAHAQQESSERWANKLFGARELRSHDFGPVKRGASLHHSFVVTNVYAVPIEVSILPMMGCTTATVEKRILQPNERTAIRITVDSSRFIGPKTSSIWVQIGPKWVSQTTLTWTANSE